MSSDTIANPFIELAKKQFASFTFAGMALYTSTQCALLNAWASSHLLL